MMQSLQREIIVETLLNTLEAEHYVRVPLLLTIVDELSSGVGLETATEAARGLLLDLQSGKLSDTDFAAYVRVLRELVSRSTTASAA